MVWIKILVQHLSLKKESLGDWKEVPQLSLPMPYGSLYNNIAMLMITMVICWEFATCQELCKCFTHITWFNITNLGGKCYYYHLKDGKFLAQKSQLTLFKISCEIRGQTEIEAEVSFTPKPSPRPLHDTMTSSTLCLALCCTGRLILPYFTLNCFGGTEDL